MIGDDTKTVYAYGEEFVSPTSIKAVYSNGATSDITFAATVNSDEFNPNLSGQYEIIISYAQYTLTYDVTVNPPTNLIQSIAISGTPKPDYEVGNTHTKPTIIGTFSDGTKDITDECEFVYNFSESGEKTVVVNEEKNLCYFKSCKNLNNIK